LNKPISIAVLVLFCSVAVSLFVQFQRQYAGKDDTPIRVGVLHSLTGSMAASEKPVADAVLMAIEEINAKGGVLGRQILPILTDGQSNDNAFAVEAERLIKEEKVQVVFGVWTSSARKAVKPIFERYNNLLIYPVQYEGLESSSNIIYLGAVPNQQIIPAVKWSFDTLGKRMALIGTDYIFPRAANEIIRLQVKALGGKIVGEYYKPINAQNFKHVVEQIITSKPDVILSTINGDGNRYFYQALRDGGISSQDIPVLSFSLAEDQITPLMTGDYAAWSYSQSLDTVENKSFLKRLKAKYGPERRASDPMLAAYTGVYLWANTAQRIGSVNPQNILAGLENMSLITPAGLVVFEPKSQALWKKPMIEKIGADGQFEVVWTAKRFLHPNPYPIFKSEAQWALFLDDLYQGWGQNWSAPLEGN